MKKHVYLPHCDLINADCLQYLPTVPNNSIDLIVTDPPYFRVKPDGWDHQWKGNSDYLKWLNTCLVEFCRVLKPSGSLYLFCGHRLAPDIEIMLRERMNVLNHIIWAKPSGRWNGCHKESLRSYFPSTERILFAEHYQGPYRPRDSGFETKSAELKQQVFSPLIDYFLEAREALGITAKEIADATGKKNMVSHWFGTSQWMMPGEQDYQKLQKLFHQVAVKKRLENTLTEPRNKLIDNYQSLRRTYTELVEEYKSLRRYFGVTSLVPYTDVWMHKPVQHYPGKHPCEKPADMLRDIICASSRPGEVIADFFMGSGSTIKEAIKLGRWGIGVELESERFRTTVEEIREISPDEPATV